MAIMSGQQRMLKVLNNEEPDRVPHFDGVDPKVMDAILPGKSHEEFVEYLDIDAIGN